MLNSQAITSIYDASFSDKLWRRALDVCGDTMAAKGVMLYEFSDLRQTEFSLEATNSAFFGIEDQLAEYNNLISEGRGSGYEKEGLSAAHRTAPFSVLLDSDVWEIDAAYVRRPEIEVGIKALGALRRSLINLSQDPKTYRGAIFLYDRMYDDGLPTFTKNIGAQLAPHIAKAVELNRLTAHLRVRYNAVLSVLDKIDTGIFLILENGEVILHNRSAQDMMDADDNLALNGKKCLSCRSGDVERKIKLAVQQLSRTAAGENNESSQLIEIPRKSKNVPLLAIVSPLRDSGAELQKGLTGALLTLIDPLRPMPVNPDILARAYGLTIAERRLATHLVRGLTNKQIAARLEVSPETVKTQLSSIYSKCGCQSRLSFVWHLFQFAPPIIL